MLSEVLVLYKFIKLVVRYLIISKLNGKRITFPENTMLGSLAKYISTENKNYQPMNANFGIIKPLNEKIKDKKEKYTKIANIAIESITRFSENLN